MDSSYDNGIGKLRLNNKNRRIFINSKRLTKEQIQKCPESTHKKLSIKTSHPFIRQSLHGQTSKTFLTEKILDSPMKAFNHSPKITPKGQSKSPARSRMSPFNRSLEAKSTSELVSDEFSNNFYEKYSKFSHFNTLRYLKTQENPLQSLHDGSERSFVLRKSANPNPRRTVVPIDTFFQDVFGDKSPSLSTRSLANSFIHASKDQEEIFVTRTNQVKMKAASAMKLKFQESKGDYFKQKKSFLHRPIFVTTPKSIGCLTSGHTHNERKDTDRSLIKLAYRRLL